MSKMLKIVAAFSIIILFGVTPSVAIGESDDGIPAHKHDHKAGTVKLSNMDKIEPSRNEVMVVVNGIVCSFCAQGVNKKLSKLPYIDRTKYKKGVKVEIEKQLVTIAVKPDSGFSLDEVLRKIKSGGYEPVTVHTNLNGEGPKIIKIKEG